MEPDEGAQPVGVAPDIVGGGGIGAAEIGQILLRPLRGLFNGGGGLGAGIAGIDQTGKSRTASPRPESVVRARDERIDIQAFRPRGAAPRAVLVLVSDEEINPAVDRCSDLSWSHRIGRGFLRLGEGGKKKESTAAQRAERVTEGLFHGT